MKLLCTVCQKPYSRLRVGFAWPTSVRCKHCGAMHSFRFGNLIGAAYMAVLIPAGFLGLLLAGRVAHVENGIYSSGPASLAVHFGTPALVWLGLSWVMGGLLSSFGSFRGPERQVPRSST